MTSSTPPRGNASTEDWAAYAVAKGHSEDEVKGLSRDQIRALVEADPKQDSTPAPAEDTTSPETDTGQAPPEDQDTPAQTAPAGEVDYSRFTGAAPAVSAENGGAPSAQTPDEADTAPAVTGKPITVDGGGATAVVLKGVYQLIDKQGNRYQARKGDTVEASQEAVDHGVRIGFLQKV